MLIELFLLIIPFLVRFLPRYLNPNKIESDTWYHLSSAQSIYNNKYKIPKCNDGYLLGGKYDYPYLSHWIVAFFTRTNIIKYEKYIASIIDFFYILVGFIYFTYLLEYYNIHDVFLKNINFILLLAFSMSMLKISTGPRVYSFTPRIFGELFTFIYFSSLHIYILNGNSIYLMIGILFGAFSLNSSKFASQVLVVFSIFLALFIQSISPLIMLFLSFLMALLISKGHYKNIFIQQLKHLKQYAVYGQYNHPTVKTRNKLYQYILFIKLLFQGQLKDAYIIFQKDLVFINILYKNIDIVVALGIVLFLDIKENFLIIMLLIGFLVFTITSYKPFQFLGESDRYLDYLVVFSVILIVLYLPQNYINILLSVEIIFYLFTLLIYFKSSNDFGKNFIEAMSYIDKRVKDKENSVIHGILGMYINYPLYLLTGINSFAIEANYVFDLNKRIMPKPMKYTNDFDYLYTQYGVNIIVANKKYLNQDIVYDFSKFNFFYENEEYIVYVRKEI